MALDQVIKKIGAYWDDYSDTFDEEHDTEDISVWKGFLLTILGEDKNKSVLDIGTGTGFLANTIAELGYASIGVDISKGMMDYAVKHAHERNTNAVYMYGSALELPFMDSTIDYIVNSRLIWTLVEPDTAIKEWARVIKPGGSIYCFNRMKDNVGIIMSKSNIYNDVSVDEKLVVSNAKMDELRGLMERNGLTNVRILELPETTKEERNYIKLEEWYQPWYALAADKPLSF